MSTSPFARFINLVSFDKKIQSCLHKQSTLESAITILQQKQRDYDNAVEQLHHKTIQLKKHVDAQELEMKVLDDKERDKKRRLEMVSDYREGKALKNELDDIHRLQSTQEAVILDAWSQLESVQTLLEKKRSEREHEVSHYDEEIKKLEQEKETLVRELSDLLVERTNQSADVPQEWLEKYDSMGKQVNNPVVSIEQDSCSGCYQQLPIPDLMRARRGALLQCKKCFRLLYLPEMIGQGT